MSDCPVCHMPAPRHHMSCYAPRVPERRFRDMSLTANEAYANASMYWDYHYLHNHDAGRAKFIDRAKRLLPLWRQWGLQELYNQGHRAACEGYEWPAWKEGNR